MILTETNLESKSSTSKQALIAGTTMQMGQIAPNCEVRFYDQSSGTKLLSVKSNNTGRYKVYLPRVSAYTITAVDKLGVFNAVIQDNVVPK